ncbi:MAG: TIGR04211 family SH3 domain-containing protein [Gammaproteobacteria bacterium]|nr:TIGR04211 family SH3 domain-containing protein [Gammaproteobacteria bacterium]
MKYCSVLVFISCLMVVLPVYAETAYVTDNLRIGVRPDPDNNAPPVGVVVSGMKLEVLKRSDDYVKVRSADGVEGWIKDIHITQDVPVRLQLEQMTDQQQRLKKDFDQQASQLKGAQQTASQMNAEIESLRNSNRQLSTALDAVGASQGNSWLWLWIILLLVMAGGGFYAGALWHRRRVMLRLGGLRF